MILSDEQMILIGELANKLSVAFEDIKAALIALANAFNENFESIKECFEQYDEQLLIDNKPDWHPPLKIVRPSQVTNRKPVMARARSNC